VGYIKKRERIAQERARSGMQKAQER